jgi:DNA-binding NarL/FixJ family response regulator
MSRDTTPEIETAAKTEASAEKILIPSADELPSNIRPLWADARPSNPREDTNEGQFTSKRTIRKIRSRKGEIAVAIIDKRAFTRESIARSLQKLCNLLKIASFVTCDEFLVSTENYDLILLHAPDGIVGEDNIVRNLMPIAPVIILSDDDSYDSVRAAFDIGVRGYIPTVSTTPELAIEIMYFVKSGGTFVPASGLSPRGISPPGIPSPAGAQQFTPRQMAVLHRLKLGKTNKIIAFELKLSESSVKAHIRNIMNKLNATNRTEVACRAHEL